MYKEAIRPAWAEINVSNFEHNIKEIKKKVGNCKIIGVIKADAYGHGAVQCAKILKENGINTFAIATLQEAITLREAGIQEEIIMLGLTPSMYANILVKYNITPVVCDYKNVQAINEEAKRAGKTVSGFVAIDTGMGRIGYLADEEDYAMAEFKKIWKLSNFKVKGFFSHMATADAADKTYAKEQEEKFNKFCKRAESEGFKVEIRTLANSASVMEIPSIYYDAVRPGIVMYGCYPSSEVDKKELSLKPVMSVKANIIHIKDVPEKFSVGYGRKYISDKKSKIATLALGYADGYPRPYSADAKVIVNGVICPIAGNICMDQCMVDVTEVPDVHVGDEVILMGSDGVNTILADDIANATGTISYEICCAFGQRLPKVYVK